MINTTKLETSTASSSGTRKCFVCEEPIRDRTVLLDLTTFDPENYTVSRTNDQVCFHPKCAKNLLIVLLTNASL